jgi:hypothetical protein
LAWFDGKRVERAEPAPPVGEPRALAVARGTLWVGGTEGAAFLPPGGAWTAVKVAPPVTALAADSEGRVWLATADGLVAASPSGAVTALPGGDFFRGTARPRAVALGAEGLWVATDKAFYNFDGSVWRRFSAPPAAAGGDAAAASASAGGSAAADAPGAAGTLGAVVDVAADRTTGRTFGATRGSVYRLATGGAGVAPRGASWLEPSAVVGFAPGKDGGVLVALRAEPPRHVSSAGGALLDAPRVDVGPSPDSGTDSLRTIGTGEGSLKAHMKGPSAGMPGNLPTAALTGAPLPAEPPRHGGVMALARDAEPRGVWGTPFVTGVAVVRGWTIVASDVALRAAAGVEPAAAAAGGEVDGAAGVGARAVASTGDEAVLVAIDGRTGAPLGAGAVALPDEKAAAGARATLRLIDVATYTERIGALLAVSAGGAGAGGKGRKGILYGAERGVLMITADAGAAGAGADFEVFAGGDAGLGSGPFTAVALAPDGSAWVAGCDALYLRRGAAWTKVPLPAEAAAAGAGSVAGRVDALTAGAGGTVWVGAGDAVWHLDREGKVLHGPLPAPGAAVSALGLAADGALWIGTRSGGVARVPPAK